MSSIPAADAVAEATATGPRPIDVTRERRVTAGSTLASHLNAAGAALPSRDVVGTVIEHLRREESMGGYEAANEMRDALERVYVSAATLVGAAPSEIALFDSASTALRTIVEALRPTEGQRIVATSSTYVSHALHLMSLARERDLDLALVPTDEGRRADLGALEEILAGAGPCIVTAAHVPTSSGLVEPVAEIGRLVRRHGGIFMLDATQSVGHLATDVREIECDVLVTTGRKFLRGPRGTAFAYVRQGLLEGLTPSAPDVRGARWTSRASWDLDGSARRFETWEGAVAARLGLGVAIDEALDRGAAATESWLCAAGATLRGLLRGIPHVQVTDPEGSESALVTFVVEGMEPATAVAALAQRSVRVVSVPATHGQWDLGERDIPSVVRASPHVYNDDGDLEALAEGVAELASPRERG